MPLIEIALFVLIGQAIGVVPTLLGVVLTGIAGGLVLRWQGLAASATCSRASRQGELPGAQLADAMLIGLGGLLLLLPGYFTDLVGLLLLLPFTRGLIYWLLARNFRVHGRIQQLSQRLSDGTIELDDDEWRPRWRAGFELVPRGQRC